MQNHYRLEIMFYLTHLITQYPELPNSECLIPKCIQIIFFAFTKGKFCLVRFQTEMVIMVTSSLKALSDRAWYLFCYRRKIPQNAKQFCNSDTLAKTMPRYNHGDFSHRLACTGAATTERVISRCFATAWKLRS